VFFVPGGQYAAHAEAGGNSIKTVRDAQLLCKDKGTLLEIQRVLKKKKKRKRKGRQSEFVNSFILQLNGI